MIIKKVLMSGSILVIAILFSHAQQKRWDAVSHDKTNFPLIGKHRTVPCGDCHQKGVLQGTPRECEACHWYRKQDDRYQLQLGIHCEDCHTPFDWKKIKPNSWAHEQAASFALEGIHKTLDCVQCHRGRNFVSQSSECIACHQEDYNKTDEPNHLLEQFPTDCRLCHNTLDWQGARYYHLSFPLQGMHKTAACASCHRNNQYSGISSECLACHLDQYNRTTSPNHLKAGFPTDCEICHGSSALDWHGAQVNHERFWPLQGAHKGLGCNECHAQGFNISSDCAACHLDDYNNTQNPNHQQVGFHTDCEVCHPVEALTWSQAVFDHGFPIFSGDHQHLACADCHRTANFMEFSCIDCHEHNKNEMDQKHKDVAGYLFNSQACYSCHPTGEE